MFRMLKADVYKTRNFWCTNGRLGSAPNCYRLSEAQVSVWWEGVFHISRREREFLSSNLVFQDENENFIVGLLRQGQEILFIKRRRIFCDSRPEVEMQIDFSRPRDKKLGQFSQEILRLRNLGSLLPRYLDPCYHLSGPSQVSGSGNIQRLTHLLTDIK